MSDIINYLQHRVEESKRELQAAAERVQQAIAERDMLGAELQGYEKALAAEMRRQGNTATPPALQANLPLAGNASADSGMGGISKAEFARQFVRERAATGVTAGELFNGFGNAGISIKRAYIYSLVQRLQEQGAIKARRGKYYPVEEEPQPASTDGHAGNQVALE